jgi:hypothetical protein
VGQADPRPLDRLAARLRGLAATLRDVFYGATGYEFERQAARLRADLENLFLFMIVGETIGVPVLPPYYALRLVPYVIDVLPYWQRRVLRERHPFESEDFDLHGV